MNETPLAHNPIKRDAANNRRKALAITTIIILAVLAIAGVAYAVYAYQQNHKLSDDIMTKNSQIAALQKKSTILSTPAVTYLDIKELGVKIKLSDDIKDAVYHYDGSNPAAPTASISSQSLINKSSQCDPKNTPAFGAITKKQSLTMPDGGTMTVNNTTVFQVGSSYFIYSTPQAPCTLNSVDQAIEISQLASFKQAVTTLQSDQ